MPTGDDQQPEQPQGLGRVATEQGVVALGRERQHAQDADAR